MSLLIKNGYVVTMNAGRAVHGPGFVEVTSRGTIGRVGDMNACPADAARTFDATGMLVLPGLINLQHRNWQHLMPAREQTSAADPLQLSKDARPHLEAQDLRAAAALAAAELISTGTTCVMHLHMGAPGDGMIDAEIEPGLNLGLRQILALDLAAGQAGSSAQRRLERSFERWHGTNDGLTWLAGFTTADAISMSSGVVTEQAVLAAFGIAQQRQVRMVVQGAAAAASGAAAFEAAIRKSGRSEVLHLMELGVLDPGVLLCGGGRFDALDASLLAESGAHVVYSPVHEAVCGGPVTPVSRLLSLGVNCALGTDGPAGGGSVDMVEQIKACAMIQNTVALDPGAMSIERALEMATIDAAQAVGLAHEIGSLEPGKRADLAVFDLQQAHLQVIHKPVSNFFCCGRGLDARLVLVGGRTVLGDGLSTGLPAGNPKRNAALLQAHAFRSRAALPAQGVS